MIPFDYNKLDSKIRHLIDIHGNNCWMGYRVSRTNPYTFHHIRKDSSGGKRELNNGAVLTKHAHNDLNLIERKAEKYYKELNRLFKALNKSKSPPTLEYYIEIRIILEEVSQFVEMSSFYNPNGEIHINGVKEYDQTDSEIVDSSDGRIIYPSKQKIIYL